MDGPLRILIRALKSRGTPRRGALAARLRGDDGFTLIETLVAAVVLIVGLATLFGLLDSSVKATYATRAREGGTNLARQVLEDARTIPYSQMAPTTIKEQLQAMHGLEDASPAAGWQVVQRGVTYTVTVAECSIDDPKDGLGVHDSTFCAGEAAGTVDPQPADLKRVTVKVEWKAQGRTPSVQQVSMISAAGEAVGLSASNLQLSSPSVKVPAEPVVTTSPGTLVFTFTAPAATAATLWSLEGARQTPAPTKSSGTTWTFSWNITGVSDGTYKVTVQAINASGVIGPPFSIPVILIRNTPAAPKVTAGGFNTVNVAGTPKKVVELQWQANVERNIIGYRVYRPHGTEKQLACPESTAILSPALSCIDFNPPEPTASNLKYEVVALYRKATAEQTLEKEPSQSPPGSFTVIGGEPLPEGPKAPENLTLTHNEEGAVVLTWENKSGTTPSFYRIYRGSTNYTSRYDVTSSGSVTTYTDTDAVGEHSYWVTAVNGNLTESPFLGPVKG